MALSTQPYKGARDFYPEDKRLQSYMFGVWRTVCERFGYEEYDAPILEPMDIYLSKTGDEIVNEQTYSFEDRGGRKVVIRPEMTPTVSRMVAGRRQQLTYPVRWYSIPNLWRYERPQRGRLREHWQLNVDIFGVASTAAEREMITLVDAIFKAFGADRSTYEVRINHRGLVDYLLTEYLLLGAKEKHDVSKLIDRMHKLDRNKFITALDQTLTPKHREAGVTEKLLALLDAKQLTDLPAEAQKQTSADELFDLIKILKANSIDNVRFDSSLMRGFDYYTGIVFEVFDNDPENNRSMMGGGRYDGLVGLFDVDPVPTVGFGWGDVTLANFLETHRLVPELKSQTNVYVAVVDNVVVDKPVTELRKRGFNVAVDLSGRKWRDQFAAAVKRGAEYILIIGADDLNAETYELKNVKTGESSRLTIAAIERKIGADAGD